MKSGKGYCFPNVRELKVNEWSEPSRAQKVCRNSENFILTRTNIALVATQQEVNNQLLH